MRIELTVRTSTTQRDVVVTAPADTEVGDVVRRLAVAGGATLDAVDPTGAVTCDGRSLLPGGTLAASSLRTGAVVRLDGAADAPVTARGLGLTMVGGAAAGTTIALRRGRLTLGRADDNDVVIDDAAASRHHVVLGVVRGGIAARDLSSTNGTWVDGVAVSGTRLLHPGEVLRIADVLFTVGDLDGVDTNNAGDVRPGTGTSVRSTAKPPGTSSDPIDVPAPMPSPPPGPVQWLAALAPVVFGVVLATALHMPQFLLFLLLSPVLILGGAFGDRARWRRLRRRSVGTRRHVQAMTRVGVETGLAAETVRRREAAPDANEIRHIALSRDDRLGQRRPGDTDHLHVRVGSADRPSRLVIRQNGVERPAGTVPDVPVSVDLTAGPLVVTGPRPARAGVVRWLMCQLAVLHSPLDLEFVLLLADGHDHDVEWARWLPHLGRVAVGRAECDAVVSELLADIARRPTSRAGSDTSPWPGRWTVVIDERAESAAGPTGALGTGTAVGYTAILSGDGATGRPAESWVRLDARSARARVTTVPFTGPVIVDRVPVEWADDLARALAALDEVAPVSDELRTSPLADVLDLPGLGDATDTIARNWAASDGGAAAPVGLGADGAVSLDLVRDGPHALVAGTTGSGKSELLRSLVCALAVRYPPDHLAFVLVDFKGGSAFGGCARLPHTVAVVTDLDPTLTRRALRSLHAELGRREKVLAGAGVADLGELPRPGAPARLIVVVDEFAELARELPDVLDGLLSVARRGRSLGVHLVLATQRPGGVVSSEIRANTSLRVALRVTDAAESDDVIGSPDAATLPADRPGRAVVRTPDSSTVMQTALAGHPATDERPSVTVLGPWRRPAVHPRTAPADGMTTLVDAVRSAADHTGRPLARSPWCPPLPESLPLPTGGAHPLPIGRIDLPDQQRQPDLVLDLDRERSVLVAGRSGSGRTTALVSMLLAATAAFAPDELEVYVVDAGGNLAAVAGRLPHVASVIGPADLRLTATLLDRLHARGSGERASRTLVLIDGWDHLVADGDTGSRRAVDALDRLARLGSRARTTLVVAGDRTVLTARAGTAGFSTRYALELTDRADVALLGVASRDVPASLPAGRAVRGGDGAAVQFARAGSLGDVVDGLVHRWSTDLRAPDAVRLQALPRTVPLAAVGPPGSALRLGLAGDEAHPLVLAPRVTSRLLVAGPPRSGRSGVLRTVLTEAVRCALPVVVAAPHRSPLLTEAERAGARTLTPDTRDDTPPPFGGVLLVDDVGAFGGGDAEDHLASWLRDPQGSMLAVVTGDNADFASAYRGPAAEIRRTRCGILLRPTRVDGELLGIRTSMPDSAPDDPPGRGVLVGDPRWGTMFTSGPLPLQIAIAA